MTRKAIPENIAKDYYFLGQDPGTNLDSCKSSLRALLKKYHPDRHAENPEEHEKALEMCYKANQAYQEIEHWLKTCQPLAN